MSEYSKTFNILPKILNGGIAAWIGIACVFPLDLVKTRLQKQTGTGGQMMYTSMFDAFKKIYKAEGITGMYRGSSVLVLLIMPEKAIKLSANDFFRYQLKSPEKNLSLSRQIVAAAGAAIVQLTVTTPMELLKIQLQDAGRVATTAQKGAVSKLSATQLTADLLKERGFFGLYKGFFATMCREVPFCCVYFPLFAKLDSMGPRKADGSGDAVYWCSFLSGLGAGALGAWICTPFDVMKTRIQTITKQETGEKTYSGVINTFRDILKNEGAKAFFKGGACRVMVIAPLYAIIQMVYFLGIAERLMGISKDVKKL